MLLSMTIENFKSVKSCQTISFEAVKDNRLDPAKVIAVNEKINLPKEYRRAIRAEMYYIKKFGLDSHMRAIGEKDRRKYILSLKGRVAYVLHMLPGNKEFAEYKNYLSRL